MVSGEVCIPGEWNYACVGGKFFHLEKTATYGFVDGHLTFYYTMIYDDWQNDWLTNNVNLCGTINLTGDKELVRENIVQTTPLLSNVNNFRYLNGKRTEGEEVNILIPEDESKWIRPKRLSSWDFIAINKELASLNLDEPNRDKLVIPFIYRTTNKYDWKWLIIKAIKTLEQRKIGIYDVAQDNDFRTTLEAKFNTNELYVISTTDHKKFNYAKTLTEAKYIEEIDLSGFTDLVQLSPTTLTPEWTSVESIPKFNLKTLCEKIRSRFNWDRNLISKMEAIATQIFAEGLGDLINSEVDRTKKKIFKNVTTAPIKRDVIWHEYQTNTDRRNPKWLEDLDSLIPMHKFYRNFIFNNDKRKSDHLWMYVGTSNYKFDIDNNYTFIQPISYHNEMNLRNIFDNWIGGSVNFYPTYNNWLNKYNGRQANIGLNEWTDPLNLQNVNAIRKSNNSHERVQVQPFKKVKLCLTSGVQLVLPIHKYKLVEVGKEESDELDFTRNDWFNDITLFLIPDYERKTHVLSIRCPISEELSKDQFGITFDITDNLNPLKGKPIYPYITTELFEINETSVTDGRWRKNLFNEWSKLPNRVTPGGAFRAMFQGVYKVKYKTYHSRCNGLSYCGYHSYLSNYSEAANGYRAGMSPFYLARVQKDGDNWIQYQVQLTLPYKQEIIKELEKYSSLHDYVFVWKVLNSSTGKGKVDTFPNPITFKDGTVQLMSNSDVAKLGTKDIIAIWINPNNNTNWVNDLKTWGLITKDEYTAITKSYGGIRDQIDVNDLSQFRKQRETQPQRLMEWLLDYFIDKSKWEHADYWGGIPLRIYSDTTINSNLRSHNGYPQLSTGIVRPHDGFDYLLYYRFHPTFDSNRFGFSESTSGFRFSNRDYFVMVIPNDWANSSSPVPEYTYREKISNLSRESNIAYLVNTYRTISFHADTEEGHIRGGFTYSNNHGEVGWKNANDLNKYMKNAVNQQDLFFEEFVKREFKSNRTCNPTLLKNEYRYNLNGWQSFKITSLDDEIPPFMVKYLDPDNTLCQILHQWKTTTTTNDADRLKEFTNKLNATVSSLKVLLSTQNTWFKLEGTDWYASVKLNIGESVTWDFELFTTKPNLIKSRTTDTWIFANHRENDIDVLINTSNEITMYGKRVMQKSRYVSDKEELDIKLKITPLPDPKQTIASTWYKVDMKTDDQDLIRDIIEIPKEQVKQALISVYERERLLRDIDLKATERESEAQLLEISRDRFKVHDSFERSENVRHAITKESHAGLDIALGITKGVMGHLSLNATAALSGYEQAARGAIDLVDAAQEYTNKERNRKARYAIGLREFDIKGEKMQKQHEVNRANSMERLWQMSSRVQHPQMNSGLIYKQFNKSEGLNDVYITQYYPSGKLLRYIKEYYKEYGYEILVRDFTCIGIENITRHLRYINIFRNEHSNARIRALIEARALNGIFVSDSEVFW